VERETDSNGDSNSDPVARRGDVRSACDSVRATTVALGQSWSPSGGGHESAESAFVLVRALGISSKLVVRGGVEPPTFRFSGGRSYQLSYLTLAGAGTGCRLRSEPGAADPSGPDGI
jgi:hypothetical protein